MQHKNIEKYMVGDTVYLIEDRIYVVECKVTSIQDEAYHGSELWVLYAEGKLSEKPYREYLESNIFTTYEDAVRRVIDNMKAMKKALKENKRKIKAEIYELDTKMESLKKFIKASEQGVI